jgi:hypothetical protein
MTVSSETSRKTFTGDGVTTSFGTSPMVFFDDADLKVYVVTTATGASTLLTLTTDYTVSGGDGSTGTVSLAGLYGAPSASQTLVIVRDVAITQGSDFVQNDASDAEVVEDALDRLTMISQQLNTRLDRSLTLADADVTSASTELPVPEASTLLGWNSGGTALANYSASALDLALVSPFMETVLDDTTAAAARTTLGASATTPADDVFRVVGSADPTKKVAFEVDGLTTATTRTITVADRNIAIGKSPTRTVLTSGSSATYTTPSGATRLNVRLVGGGGGGGAQTTNNGTAGNSTTFTDGTLTLTGGGGGAGQANTGSLASGGTASGGDINIPGGQGQGSGTSSTASTAIQGGQGGSTAFGGGGAGGGVGQTGGSGATNSGGGGGGAGAGSATPNGGGGGGGGYVEKLITTPSASYTYTVGATANGGSAGGVAGGAGAAGVIIIDEYYN